MQILIRLSIFSLFLTSFSMPVFAQEKSKSDKFNTMVAKEYNQKVTTVASVIDYIAKKNPTKAEEIKTYSAENHMPLSYNLPKMIFENGYLIIKDKRFSNFKFKAIRDTLLISYQDRNESVQLSTNIKDAAAIFDKLLSPKTTLNLMNLIISPAHADGGPLELVGMAAAGVGAMVLFGTLGVMDSISNTFKGISEIPSDFIDGRTFKASEKMCNDITQNKPVKDVDKMITKLEAFKKKEECDLYPNLRPEYQCIQADERLKCLKDYLVNATEVSNTSRGLSKEKEAQENSKDSKDTKESSAATKK